MEDARLIVNGQELTLPTITGSEGEVAIDISALRKQTGITTFDRGFGNTAEAQSAITFINGEKGILRYRGYPIEQLATQADFLEVAWLLSNGELPTNDVSAGQPWLQGRLPVRGRGCGERSRAGRTCRRSPRPVR